MATVRELKATARLNRGKGGADRREGRVPGVVYGDGKPPVNISLDYADVRQRIFAGKFLTTLFDLELDGVKHRVIPREFQLDPVRPYIAHGKRRVHPPAGECRERIRHIHAVPDDRRREVNLQLH